MENRAKWEYNVIQAVTLAEFDGVSSPNAHGRLPFKPGADSLPDPLRPDTDGPYSYWDHVDYIVDTAEELGLYEALLPTWRQVSSSLRHLGTGIGSARRNANSPSPDVDRDADGA
ncbi:DUF4038 domain-containing protein [Paenibacillus sacheonensis]|uniref:apiosidase-like domain-containing protein n=1 Tax=Paenibacillus sacheonensis TaxID=742054 RepID=UPI001EF78E9D|nr:DUF4038 domain-containing protein [Paenibacillus sacheonensis]MBM7563957.1 hypothetical protein [Paenibacillus sacheonensis]